MLYSESVKPHYDHDGFAGIPRVITDVFTQDAVDLPAGLPTDYDAVILFFIDAFGWRFVEQYADRSPFLQRLFRDGVARKLTSQFPSTTAAHVTTMHTGLPVGQHGVFEWQFYEPQLDTLIAPLLFSFAGDHDRETLQALHVDPQALFPAQTIYRQLQQHGVESFVFQPLAFAHSSYSRTMQQGATIMPYGTLPEALVNVGYLLLDRTASPRYIYLYFNAIDATCHTYGPESAQLHAEIDTLLSTMERVLMPLLSQSKHRTLVLLTADHGQTAVDPHSTLYLNRDSAFADLHRYIRTDARGTLLIPAGSPRDMFLYVKDGLVDEAQAYLSERLAGRAHVLQVNDLLTTGMFGPEPISSVFRARAGDLVILPFDNETIWWYEQGRFEQKFRGHHGGLTAHEMEIPLLLYPIGC